MLISFSQTDPETQALIAAFKQRFKELGWTEGGNVQIDYRFTDGNPERTRLASAELVGLTPDVILADANPAVSLLMQVTKSIPIVFTRTSDPVGSGFVSNLAHPGGNVTGFHSFEPAIAGKWLEVLKELAPGVRRAAVVHHPDIAANVAFVRAAEAASSTFGVTITSAAVRNAKDIEETITKFAQEPNGGLVVAPAPPTFNNRELVVALAARFFSSAGRLFIPFLCHKWRTGLVWLRRERYMAGCRCLCRPCSTRRKTRRFAGATARQVSAGD